MAVAGVRKRHAHKILSVWIFCILMSLWNLQLLCRYNILQYSPTSPIDGLFIAGVRVALKQHFFFNSSVFHAKNPFFRVSVWRKEKFYNVGSNNLDASGCKKCERNIFDGIDWVVLKSESCFYSFNKNFECSLILIVHIFQIYWFFGVHQRIDICNKV